MTASKKSKKNKKKKELKPNDPIKILVVGDWLVDEHWVTGSHRSSTSSRTGKKHLRTLHGLESTVESFCGAGMTASLLYQLKSTIGRKYNIYGLGLWHKDDTKILKEMFEVQNLKGRTLYSLNRPESKAMVNDVNLINLLPVLNKEEKKHICTTRIIRIYESVQPSNLKYFRIDWELPPLRNPNTDEKDQYPSIIKKEHIKNMNKILSDLPKEVDAIVIKDLKKGVISKQLIDFLINKYKNKTKWFVSSKNWMPDWFKSLKKVDLRLLLIPQVASQQVVNECKLSRWIAKGNTPSEMAFKLIKDLIEKVGKKHKNLKIFVIPVGFSVIAYDPNKKKDNCIVQPNPKPFPPFIQMFMASVFLPALISELLVNKPNQKGLKDLLDFCLISTYKWVKYEGERISHPEAWSQKVNFMAKETSNITNELTLSFNIFTWEDEEKYWKQSMKKLGVINKNGQKTIEIWRSMLEVDGYVCCVEEKRKEIRKLMQGIHTFFNRDKTQNISCMIIAKPGSGKTHLVRSIAKSLHLRFLPFNITQMFNKGDIIDCFDTVMATQAENKDQPILVFNDEIDAHIGGSNVYDAFLAPLEDGVYIRGGKAFHINPCIWIFSGTKFPPSKGRKNDENIKTSDFISRLTLDIIDLKKEKKDKRREIEKLYVAVNLLREEFPDVRFISDKVLKAFACLPEDIGVRDIKHFIKSFHEIQYGKVLPKNIPMDMFKKIVKRQISKYSKYKEKCDKIEIIY